MQWPTATVTGLGFLIAMLVIYLGVRYRMYPYSDSECQSGGDAECVCVDMDKIIVPCAVTVAVSLSVVWLAPNIFASMTGAIRGGVTGE
jgi:hypothetical protein